MVRRLLWHPCGENNKFVVANDSKIALYEWAPALSEIRPISSQYDLQFMKCLAWSPDPKYDDLLAVGLATGRVDLLRLEAPRHDNRTNVLSPTGPTVSLPVLKSRACNALAFCHTDPNLLAVGLDKVRAEGSLMIWDINTASSSFTSALGLTSVGQDTEVTNPHRKHQVPRGDIGPRTDPRVLQQHAPAEAISCVTFLRNSSHLLLAGISYRWLRLFDIRTPVPSTTNVASKIYGIATDPLDANRIASFGEGVITIWDARKLPHPVLTFTEKDAGADGGYPRPQSMYTQVEFSSTRRGRLAVLESHSSHVRFWDMMESQPKQVETAQVGRTRTASLSRARKSWATLGWGGGGGGALDPPQSPRLEVSSVVLSDTRQTKIFDKPLASFALVPSAKSHPISSDVMVVNHEGDLELYALHDTPKQLNWSARGDFAMGACTSYRVFSGAQSSTEQRTSRESSRNRALRAQSESTNIFAPQPTNAPPVLFGRGDKEGFPAVGHPPTPDPISPPISQPIKMRVYSPSNLRQINLTLAPTESSSTPRSRPTSRLNSRDPSADVRHSRGRSGGPKRENASRHAKQQLKSVSQIVQGDISMTMRKRALEGYGLSNPPNNSIITEQEGGALSDLWVWISNASDFLCHPVSRIGGYEFAHVGVSGIWEGFPPRPQSTQSSSSAQGTPQRPLLDVPPSRTNSRRGHDRTSSRRAVSPTPTHDHEDFHAALVALTSRKGATRSWKPTVATSKTVHRQAALQLCGWNLIEDELMKDIRQWEAEGKISRAACWLVFTKQAPKAIDLLMRSDEETHQMMSGTLAALTSPGSGKNTELKEHCERLIVRMQDPYFRAMLTHLTSGEWSQILEEEEILPLKERLAIALQFLDDNALSSYLRRSTERAKSRGEIDALVITGLTSKGVDILQGYVDFSGDVQSAAILGSFVHPTIMPQDRRVQHWVDSYRDMLDGMKLFHHRVGFDIERGQILNDAMLNGDIPTKEWVPRQITIRCNYCNKPVTSGKGSTAKGHRPTVCQNCDRPLPRCSVCLLVLRIVPDDVREAELAHSPHKDTIDDAIVTCQTCRHAGHAGHILDWFFGEQSRGVCAVANCDCRCADEF